ncbi:putative oxidoreductase, 2OG-Fe(II) oxygenase family [Variovorax paradoxus B4]|uniref:Putative oxidoreductase, 2OG-Fe(II) oxygenase family n=1 Tax=Variovorax paradoxus B4 TaxID=1246301 RepID=T1XFT5_VARPD|nr:2-oxoglutarate and iron-dependent oxygenase domain-containing protein [Variovorax paradoxus]AGU51184.1 putative oxidoreductase, 2OG-Fe(II) oxygenase family [Variovorax paradoxus B4]
MSIPILDLQEALAPGGARSAAVAAQLRAAAMASGFFYVRNHGVSGELVARQFCVAHQLMALPQQRRQALSMQLSPTMRGFENIGAQTLDAAARPDLKESFYCGMAYPDDHPYVRAGYQTYGHNQWPSELPDAPAQCETYIRTMLGLSTRLMQLMALSLGLPEDYFDATSADPMVTLRMVRYPAHPVDADERTFGAGAHTDWGAITILAQDAHGGLEVCMPDGDWVPATPVEGCFVVNLGDMIPRWTNGLYHSNPHRVRNLHSGGAPRYSIPFFYEPGYFARIEAVPGTVPAGEAPRHAPCTAGEHLREMYRKTYGLKTGATDATSAASP